VLHDVTILENKTRQGGQDFAVRNLYWGICYLEGWKRVDGKTGIVRGVVHLASEKLSTS